MFDISWGEFIIMTGIGFAIIGKKDLPRAAGWLGNRVGRTVGLLQGARVRAEQFAQQSELKQLHDEFKTGLRELDAVKYEMSSTMSSSSNTGSIQRTVLRHAEAQPPQLSAATATAATTPNHTPPPTSTTSTFNSGLPMSGIPTTAAAMQIPSFSAESTVAHHQPELSPEYQTIGAVAEDAWEKQGIAFRSRAERGVGLGYSDEDANNPLNSGSSILATVYKQNLIYDQYDRVTQQQKEILKSKPEMDPTAASIIDGKHKPE